MGKMPHPEVGEAASRLPLGQWVRINLTDGGWHRGKVVEHHEGIGRNNRPEVSGYRLCFRDGSSLMIDMRWAEFNVVEGPEEGSESGESSSSSSSNEDEDEEQDVDSHPSQSSSTPAAPAAAPPDAPTRSAGQRSVPAAAAPPPPPPPHEGKRTRRPTPPLRTP